MAEERRVRLGLEMDNVQYLLHFLTGPQDFKSLLHVAVQRGFNKAAAINEKGFRATAAHKRMLVKLPTV
ncbi:hypothetical protein ACH3XW_28255 [Acanthocheilonema viteae]